MKDLINTIITVDGVKHRVIVTQPFGAGSYHVYVDKMYAGQIAHYTTGWTPFVKSPYLTSDDIQAMLDIINGYSQIP